MTLLGESDRTERGPSGPGGPAALPRRAFLRRLGAAGVVAGGLGWAGRSARGEEWRPLPVGAYGAEVAIAWFEHALDLIRTTPGFSPPVAARALGYAGVALYEAVAPGMPGARSLAGQLKELAASPPPADLAYHWPTVASSALGAIFRQLAPTAPVATRAGGMTLETRLAAEFRSAVPPAVLRRSLERGLAVADHVFAWSKSDGGHEGYARNTAPYTPPTGPGLWVPTPPGFQAALQPGWGANRPFVLASGSACPPLPPVPFSTAPRSDFYAEAYHVYHTVGRLTPEQHAIALFWSDAPGQTATPAGHSVAILSQVLRGTGAGLDVAAEAYAKLGLAVADAFIACWNAKYRVNLLRPVTYIRSVIDPAWSPPLVTPPFPEHTSGHSVQVAAAAEVLTALFGHVPFTDHTHDAPGLPPRAFGSFWHAAREAAISRLYGGIHFMGAIVAGLDQGRCIGRAVSALRLRRA